MSFSTESFAERKLHQQAQYARSEAIGAARVLSCLIAADLLSSAGYDHGTTQVTALNAKADALEVQLDAARETTTQAT